MKILEGEHIDLNRETRGVYVMSVPGRPGLKIGAIGINSEGPRSLNARINEIGYNLDGEICVHAFADLGDNRYLVGAVEALSHLSLSLANKNTAEADVEGINRRDQFNIDEDEAKRALKAAIRTARIHDRCAYFWNWVLSIVKPGHSRAD